MHYLKHTFLCVSLTAIQMILAWARGHTYFREEGSHFLHTSFQSIFIIIILLFLPLITSSEKLAEAKPELLMGLHASHSSRYPKWFRSSLISLWIIYLLQKKGGEQMCKTETEVLWYSYFSSTEGRDDCVYWGGEGERSIYAEEQQKLKTWISD